MPARCASLVASACACERAAMNEISASRTAICIGSLVAPSKTRPLITVRRTMPRFMNSMEPLVGAVDVVAGESESHQHDWSLQCILNECDDGDRSSVTEKDR